MEKKASRSLRQLSNSPIQLRTFLQQDNGEAPPNSKQERKQEVKRLLIAIGILLIAGVSHLFLASYVKGPHYFSAPLIIVNLFLLPLFWGTLSWTLMQASGVLGIVEIKQTKQGRVIYIAVLTLLLLYVAIMLPFIVESLRCMVLEIQYFKNPAAYPNGLSYSFHLPIFLQMIVVTISNISFKPCMFNMLGMILWLSGQSAKRRDKTERST